MTLFSEGKLSALSFLFFLYLNTSTHATEHAGLLREEIKGESLFQDANVCIQTTTSAVAPYEFRAGFGNEEPNCLASSSTDPNTQYCNFGLRDNRILQFVNKKNFMVDAASNFTEVWKTKISYEFPVFGQIGLRPLCLVDQDVTCDMCGPVCVIPQISFVGNIVRIPRLESCPYKSDTNLTASIKMPEFPEYLTALVAVRSTVNLQLEYNLKEGNDTKQSALFNITLWKRDFVCGPQ